MNLNRESLNDITANKPSFYTPVEKRALEQTLLVNLKTHHA
jgi:hypothetical protein